MPRARADKFRSASSAAKPRPFSQMRRRDQKNRTRIGPHLRQPRSAESRVISVAKIGYVRRSEVINVMGLDVVGLDVVGRTKRAGSAVAPTIQRNAPDPSHGV